MAIPLFLAMTGAEFAAAGTLPKTAAWMACHFFSGDAGITNIPSSLPPGSLLILNDQIPLSGHNLGRVGEQLQQAADALDSRGVLLDFQRSHVPESKELAAYLDTTFAAMTTRQKGNTYYRDYSLTQEAKEQYQREYGFDGTEFLSAG